MIPRTLLLLGGLGLLPAHLAGQNAETLYREACDSGDATSCGLLGLMYERGEGVAQDMDSAVRFLARACDGGAIDTCNHLGVLHLQGEIVEQRFDLALAAFQQACDAEEMSGCVNLGVMHRDGLGVDADFASALSLFQQACLGGHEEGCAQVELTRAPPEVTRFAVPPQIDNVEEVQRALVRNYPSELARAGIGSTVRVWMFVGRDGRVAASRLASSSRIRELDEAALAVADVFRFTPAVNPEGETVAVWVSFPITFQVR